MVLGTPRGVAWWAIVMVVLTLAPASVTASRGASAAQTATAPAGPNSGPAVEACRSGPGACEAPGPPAQRTDDGMLVHAAVPAGTAAHPLSGIMVIVVDDGKDDINSSGSEGLEGPAAHPASDPRAFPGPGAGLVLLAVAAAAALVYLSRRRRAHDSGATKTPLRDPDRSNGHQNGYHAGTREDGP